MYNTINTTRVNAATSIVAPTTTTAFIRRDSDGSLTYRVTLSDSVHLAQPISCMIVLFEGEIVHTQQYRTSTRRSGLKSALELVRKDADGGLVYRTTLID